GVARLERLPVAGDEVRVLMGLQPNPVPQPVEELGAVAAGGDDPASSRVEVLAGHARPDGSGGGGLRLVQHAEQSLELGVGTQRRVTTANPDRARRVGGVTIKRATDV